MPWMSKKTPQCPKDRPWGIFRKDTGKLVGCSASEEDAEASIRARYAAMEGEEDMEMGSSMMGGGITGGMGGMGRMSEEE